MIFPLTGWSDLVINDYLSILYMAELSGHPWPVLARTLALQILPLSPAKRVLGEGVGGGEGAELSGEEIL